MCPNCHGSNVAPHLEWVDGRFRAGKSMCGTCGALFATDGAAEEPVAAPRGRGRPRREEAAEPEPDEAETEAD